MELYKKAENPLGVANVASQMGLLQYEQKNFGEAERLYRQALEVFQEKEARKGKPICCLISVHCTLIPVNWTRPVNILKKPCPFFEKWGIHWALPVCFKI